MPPESGRLKTGVGSGDKTLLGDLDIGVHVGPARLPEADRTKALMLWLKNGKQPPEAKSMSALRLRKPNLISLHSLEEVLSLGTPYRVVFGSIPEKMLETRSYDRWFSAKVQASLADGQPGTPHDQVMVEAEAIIVEAERKQAGA